MMRNRLKFATLIYVATLTNALNEIGKIVMKYYFCLQNRNVCTLFVNESQITQRYPIPRDKPTSKLKVLRH